MIPTANTTMLCSALAREAYPLLSLSIKTSWPSLTPVRHKRRSAGHRPLPASTNPRPLCAALSNPARPDSSPASLFRRAVRASCVPRDPTRTAPGCLVVQGTRSAGAGGGGLPFGDDRRRLCCERRGGSPHPISDASTSLPLSLQNPTRYTGGIRTTGSLGMGSPLANLVESAAAPSTS
jgi:hypothetical protein